MEKLKVQHNNDADSRRADSDIESNYNENDFLFAFLFPPTLRAGYPTGAKD